jgi:predicted RNA-binding Zn ribbon-like protein
VLKWFKYVVCARAQARGHGTWTGGSRLEPSFLRLLNSDWRDWRSSGHAADRLDDLHWVQSFLGRWDLVPDLPPGQLDVARLSQLRSLLRTLVDAVRLGAAAPEPALRELNSYLGASTLRQRLDAVPGGYAVRLEPAARDWDWVLAEIAASFARILADGDPTRLRQCGNPDCNWVFYDDSKNRARRWCADTCGTLMRVRRFRARHRRSPAETSKRA